MTDQPKIEFDKDLYRGTAEFYDRFRPPYPAGLLHDLSARAGLTAQSRVLDLACGTGQIAFGVAASVAEVWAIDQEPDFIELGKHKAQRLGVDNIRWAVASAEDLALEGSFDLVAIGNAFHRLERHNVTRRLVRHLGASGCIGLVWSWSPWSGPRDWQRVLSTAIDRWIVETNSGSRIPSQWHEAMVTEPHEQVLRSAGLDYKGRFELEQVERWTVESLIGNVYSTSVLNPRVLGHRRAEFTDDISTRLMACEPTGVFHQDQVYAYDLARRPA